MKAIKNIRVVNVSETSISLFLGDEISIYNNRLLQAARSYFLDLNINGLQEIVLCYNSLTLFYNPLPIFEQGEKPAKFMRKLLEDIPWAKLENISQSSKNGVIDLPVKYGSEDLELLEGILNLTSQEIIELHTASDYQVFMIGFLPGFPYLGILPKQLQVARKAKPSSKVLEGSVSIAGMQTGIYSFDSPGGWYTLGNTKVKMYDLSRTPRLKFAAGDRVRFRSI